MTTDSEEEYELVSGDEGDSEDERGKMPYKVDPFGESSDDEEHTVIIYEGRATINNVGYNTAGNTALIVQGTTLEVYGAKFVIAITEGPYASYSPQYVINFKGKEVVFTFTEVDGIRRPRDAKFVRVEGVTQ